MILLLPLVLSYGSLSTKIIFLFFQSILFLSLSLSLSLTLSLSYILSEYELRNMLYLRNKYLSKNESCPECNVELA